MTPYKINFRLTAHCGHKVVPMSLANAMSAFVGKADTSVLLDQLIGDGE
jgi:hypothetical protein